MPNLSTATWSSPAASCSGQFPGDLPGPPLLPDHVHRQQRHIVEQPGGQVYLGTRPRDVADHHRPPARVHPPRPADQPVTAEGVDQYRGRPCLGQHRGGDGLTSCRPRRRPWARPRAALVLPTTPVTVAPAASACCAAIEPTAPAAPTTIDVLSRPDPARRRARPRRRWWRERRRSRRARRQRRPEHRDRLARHAYPLGPGAVPQHAQAAAAQHDLRASRDPRAGIGFKDDAGPLDSADVGQGRLHGEFAARDGHVQVPDRAGLDPHQHLAVSAGRLGHVLDDRREHPTRGTVPRASDAGLAQEGEAERVVPLGLLMLGPVPAVLEQLQLGPRDGLVHGRSPRELHRTDSAGPTPPESAG